MVLSEKERKERRVAGMQRDAEQLSMAKKVQRTLMSGRPPVSELKTPNGAVNAAKTWHRRIESEIEDVMHGQGPKRADYFGVVIVYVSPDLSCLGLSSPYASREESQIERELKDNLAIGLIFGISDGQELVMGKRPFLVTKQTDEWLQEMVLAAKSQLELDRLER